MKFEVVQDVSKSIVEINPEPLWSHGHGDEALSIVSELKPIFTSSFLNALIGFWSCSTRHEMHRAAIEHQSVRGSKSFVNRIQRPVSWLPVFSFNMLKAMVVAVDVHIHVMILQESDEALVRIQSNNQMWLYGDIWKDWEEWESDLEDWQDMLH